MDWLSDLTTAENRRIFMLQNSFVTKTILLLITLQTALSAFAGGGNDHSHGPGEGDHGMQVLGVVVIVVLAGGVIWFLSNRKK